MEHQEAETVCDDVYLLCIPDDGLCEGCREPLGEEVFEDDMGLVLCRGCWELCEEDDEA